MAQDIFNDVLKLGDDQKANQYQLILTSIPGYTGTLTATDLALRIDQPFDIPEIMVGEYEFHTRGFRFTRPSMLEETDKHITFQVRVDQKWNTFDALQSWRKAVYNWENTTSQDSTTVYGDNFATTATIDFLDGAGKSKLTCQIDQLILKGLQISSIDPASNEPSRLTLNCLFGTYSFTRNA
jgi:hypothetical protein